MKQNTAKNKKLSTINHKPSTAQREQLKIVIVGHVDHGKSTLVGRIFHDTDSLPEGKFEQIKAQCERRGMPFEWSFLTDALQSERDQGITVDTTQIWFKTPFRDYVIIDAPGHKEFLKNMISGAANSEAALLVIDAKEGVREQSKRHGYLLHLLGVSQIAVAVNKMDLVDYSEKRFKEIEKEYRAYLKSIGVTPTFIIPISGREGDNIIRKDTPHPTSPRIQPSPKGFGGQEQGEGNMPWYKGPTVIEALDHFKLKPKPTDLPLRFPVQDVYKFDERRIIAGRIESGTLKVGDEIIISPSNKAVKVSSIERWPTLVKSSPPARGGSVEGGVSKRHPHPNPLPQAGEGNIISAGMSVGITLSEQIFIERGNIISHRKDAPILTNIFRAKLFWLGDDPIEIGNKYKLKLSTSEYNVEVKEIEQVVDTGDLSHVSAKKVEKNAVAEVIFRVRGIAALDEFESNAVTGRFVLVENYRICGGGIIDMKGFANQRVDLKVKSQNIFAVESKITPVQRAIMNGHKGGVLWFSGLSGSGKTTIAHELQRRLFNKGYQVFVLDGDNIRGRLNADLGFSPTDRSENLRRVGEVAALFANAGIIVITSFISPYKKDRDHARVAAGEAFHSVYIKADIKTCEKRDPKGLYKKARKGEIKDFTGVSAPFEEPENADLVIDTTKNSIEECVSLLAQYAEKNLVEPVKHITEEGVNI